MNIECFIQLLVKHVTPEQIDALLAEISGADDGGHCPICEEDDIPVDERGIEVTGDDMDMFEWEPRHTDECPVTYLEKLRTQ